MALIIPQGFGHAVYEMRLVGDNEPIVVTCGHDLGDVTGGEYSDAAQLLMNSFGTHVMPMVNQAYELLAVNLYVGQDGGPPFLYESEGAPVAGGESGTTVPQNTAMLIKKATSSAGRRGRGRMYLPSIPEAAVDHAGNITTAWVGFMQDAFDDWFEELTTGGVSITALPPVILHREEGAGVEPPPTPVTAFVVDTRAATQRRRMRR